MHVYGFVALSSQFLFLPLFLYDGVVVIVILMAFSGLVLFATLSLFSPRTFTSEALGSVPDTKADIYKSFVVSKVVTRLLISVISQARFPTLLFCFQ